MSITGHKKLLLRNKDEITLLQKKINWISQIKGTDSSSVSLSTLVIA